MLRHEESKLNGATKDANMGRLYVFEGPDGVGKSTLVSGLCKRLQTLGQACACFSFPGKDAGTLGRHVYELHHEPERFGITQMSGASLQFLHIAAHVDAIERSILPALQKGETVLLDRYWWSTLVYGLMSDIPSAQLDHMIAAEKCAWRGVCATTLFLLKRKQPRGNRFLLDTYNRLAQGEMDKYHIVKLENERSIDSLIGEALSVIIPDAEVTRGGCHVAQKRDARTHSPSF